MATANGTVSMSGLIVDRSSTEAASTSASPTRTSVRAGYRPARREPASAVRNSVTETGSMRRPVSKASNPWTICR
jgi:hypothetical protein